MPSSPAAGRARERRVQPRAPLDPLRLTVVADFREERWPSMDLAADMLVQHASGLPGVTCELLRPKLWPLSAVPADSPPRAALRAVGRFIQYPIELGLRDKAGQLFHIADHTYAHLAHHFAGARVGVYCHDLDAFRVLLPAAQGGPARRASGPRRAMARYILSGLRRAAVVFYSTEAVRAELSATGLLPHARLVHAPYGIATEFSALETEEDRAVRARHPRPFLLHVGSCIPRKNTGFLLRVFAEARRALPELELMQIGGEWPPEQRALIAELGVGGALEQRRGISRAELAALYRRAALVLLPSHAEGFGLPLIEALACGAKVIATDLPVLREVGGDAAVYVPGDDLSAWVAELQRLWLTPAEQLSERASRRAALYSWHEHARRIVSVYRDLTSTPAPDRS